MELGIISGGDLETSVWILHHDANPCPSLGLYPTALDFILELFCLYFSFLWCLSLFLFYFLFFTDVNSFSLYSWTIGKKLPLDANNPAHGSLLRVNSPSHGIFSFTCVFLIHLLIFLSFVFLKVINQRFSGVTKKWLLRILPMAAVNLSFSFRTPSVTHLHGIRLRSQTQSLLFLHYSLSSLFSNSSCLLLKFFMMHPMSCLAVTFMTPKINSNNHEIPIL